MATTTNFNWSTPDDTSLVKDGAAAIRTLGQSIDTSMAELKGGTTGQVLSKTSNTDMDFTWVAQDDSNAIQNAIVDAKGDLIAASAADTPARLAVGTNGQVLTADSTASTGLAWATPASSGGMTLLSTTSLSGSSVTISSLSGSYTDLRIVMKGAYASGDSDLFVRLNSDTGSNYAHYSLQTNDTTASGFYADSATQVQIGFITGTNTYNQRTSFVMDLPRYTDTSNCFGISTLSTYAFSGRRQIQNFFKYNNSAAITSFTIYPSSGTFSGGSLYIYGVK